MLISLLHIIELPLSPLILTHGSVTTMKPTVGAKKATILSRIELGPTQ